jgi:dTDP-4-amino-4,6-dideoxygalactose transaminase
MELGSEFNLDMHDLKIFQNSFFKYIGNMQYCLFDSGRSALKAITRVLGDGYVLMPEYICESVIKCFSIDQIIFYKLKENLQIDANDLLNKINSNTAVVYLMHYFGSLQPENVLSLLRAEKEKYGFTIIEDTTHSIFSKKQTVGDYCVASLRKWFAVPNGGVLYSDNPLYLNSYDEIRRSTDNDKAYAMMLKTLYLNGQLDCNSEYRKIFAACEEKLDTQKNIRRISDFSEFLLSCNDVYDMVKKRKSNLNRLKNKLSNIKMKQICNFTEKDCPFTLPVMVPDRDDFRKYLMENKIYCAVHWPFDGLAPRERPLAFALSNNMISLPIDQRYKEEEMAYLLKVIGAYKGRLKS